jgi:hypothetical protein
MEGNKKVVLLLFFVLHGGVVSLVNFILFKKLLPFIFDPSVLPLAVPLWGGHSTLIGAAVLWCITLMSFYVAVKYAPYEYLVFLGVSNAVSFGLLFIFTIYFLVHGLYFCAHACGLGIAFAYAVTLVLGLAAFIINACTWAIYGIFVAHQISKL